MMMQGLMMPGGNELENRRSMWLNVFARLKPGVSRQQAEAAMNVFWKPILESEAKDLTKASQNVRTKFLNRHLFFGRASEEFRARHRSSARRSRY